MSTRGQCHKLTFDGFYQFRNSSSHRIFTFIILDLKFAQNDPPTKKHPEEAKDSRTEGRREEKDKSRTETAAVLWEHGQNSDAASTRLCFWSTEAGRKNLDPQRQKQLPKKGVGLIQKLLAGQRGTSSSARLKVSSILLYVSISLFHLKKH